MLASDDRLGRPGAGHDDVSGDQMLFQSIEGNAHAAEFFGQILGFNPVPVADQQFAGRKIGDFAVGERDGKKVAAPVSFPRGPVAIEESGDQAGFDFVLLFGVEMFLVAGFVPGVTDPDSGWASGTYEEPTRDAVLRFQRSIGYHQTGNIWPDDWNRLLA